MTDPTPTRDEAVPTGWRYSINYGPDGEQNFANVYAADSQFVGNLRTHHAIAICNAFAVCEKLASAPAPASGGVDAVAWRAVAHAETEMGAMIHPIKRYLIQDADGIYGKGQWDLQALVVAPDAADDTYNVSEGHMFGPVEDALSPAATPVSEAGGEADAYLRALLDYSAGFYGAAIEHGMKSGPAADAVQHIERAARNLHRLAALAKPASSPAGGLDVRFDALYDAFKRGVAWGREMPDAVGPEIEKGAYDYADKNTPPLSQSTFAGRVGG